MISALEEQRQATLSMKVTWHAVGKANVWVAQVALE
jgi:hypothetical protein